MEGLLAGLLRYGALVASGWIALGIAFSMFDDASPLGYGTVATSDRCLSIGIVLLIALPVLRVALTTAVFLFDKDYLFAAISGAVLLIIALGFVLGVLSPNGGFL
jgi:Protein of unknown function (DUF1634)